MGKSRKLVEQKHHKCLQLNHKNNVINVCQRANKDFEKYLVGVLT